MDTYKETFVTWNKVAKLYQDKFMDLDLYNDTYDTFCDQVNIRNATILDIGCGPGKITKYLLNKRPDFRIEGIDISPNMIELAKKNDVAVIIQEMQIPTNYGARYTKAFNDIFHDLAKQFSIPLIPFFLQEIALEPSLMQNDGIHPTKEAQHLIVDFLAPKLLAAIES